LITNTLAHELVANSSSSSGSSSSGGGGSIPLFARKFDERVNGDAMDIIDRGLLLPLPRHDEIIGGGGGGIGEEEVCKTRKY